MKAVLSAFFLAGLTLAAAPVPCHVLAPRFDAAHAVVTAKAADGHAYPVVQLAPPSKLLDQVQRELAHSYAQRVLHLDRYLRNSTQDPAPMYLLMSAEEGGFARFGFWLEDAAGKRTLVKASYVDLVVDERSVKSGNFEEIFSHELGHLILQALLGTPLPSRSHKMHQSMAVTDYATAFDEGFAEHFQPMARDATENPVFRRAGSDFDRLWLSGADTELRTDGVKHNVFIHRKPLPATAYDPQPDLYRLFVEDETSTVFLPAELRNGQQMMASEGVIATLFYRFVNDPQLSAWRRPAAFYRPFGVTADQLTAHENVYLKLFAAITQLHGYAHSRAPMIELVEHYARLFPDEAARIRQLFIETTWGATASPRLANAFVDAARAGQRGDIAAFRASRPFKDLDALIADVSAGRRALDAGVGPEFWIENRSFLIASPIWRTERTKPLALNLNTATVVEWMTLPGIDLKLAQRIVAVRDALGCFRIKAEMRSAGVPDAVLALF